VPQSIESAATDKGFEHFVIDHPGIHAHAKINQSAERAVGLPFPDDGLGRLCADVLNAGQPAADGKLLRRETYGADIDIGRKDFEAHGTDFIHETGIFPACRFRWKSGPP